MNVVNTTQNDSVIRFEICNFEETNNKLCMINQCYYDRMLLCNFITLLQLVVVVHNQKLETVLNSNSTHTRMHGKMWNLGISFPKMLLLEGKCII